MCITEINTPKSIDKLIAKYFSIMYKCVKTRRKRTQIDYILHYSIQCMIQDSDEMEFNEFFLENKTPEVFQEN